MHSWSQLDSNVVFISSNPLNAEDQMCGKIWLPMKSISSLIFLLVRLVFSCCEFIAVLRQVQAWDRKSAGNTQVGMVGRFLKLLRGGSRQKILTHAGLYCKNMAVLEKLSAGQ